MSPNLISQITQALCQYKLRLGHKALMLVMLIALLSVQFSALTAIPVQAGTSARPRYQPLTSRANRRVGPLDPGTRLHQAGFCHVAVGNGV